MLWRRAVVRQLPVCGKLSDLLSLKNALWAQPRSLAVVQQVALRSSGSAWQFHDAMPARHAIGLGQAYHHRGPAACCIFGL